MNLMLPIPDDLAERLGSADSDMARRALEAFGVAEYRATRLTRPELRRLLGFVTAAELDGFLKMHGFADTSSEERDRANQDRTTSPVARIRAFRVGKTLGGLAPATLIREGRR